MAINTAELEMELELEAVKKRYTQMFEDGEVEVAEGLHAKPIKGQTSEAWVTIYSAADGTASRVTTDAASKKIKQRNADGTPQFLLHPDPRYQYRRDPVTGILTRMPDHAFLCRLHPQHPDREWLDSIGLASQTCTVDTIPNAFQFAEHMRVKHKGENAAIQREEQNRREQEQMEVQRNTAEAMMALARRGPGRAPKDEP